MRRCSRRSRTFLAMGKSDADIIDGYQRSGRRGASAVAGQRRYGHRAAAQVEGPADLAERLAELVAPGDIVVCLGAGDITKWAANLASDVAALKGRHVLSAAEGSA